MLFSPFLSLHIFLLFIVMAISLIGWGTALGKLCKIPFDMFSEKEEKILMGVACLYLFSGIWNFFFPITKFYSYLFLLIGCILFVLENKISRKSINWINPLSAFLFILFSFHSVTNYDTYLYHTDTIRWINEYAVVPGLANIHSRLGFNQFFFYFPAMTENLLPDKGLNIANPFLAWITTCYFANMLKKTETRCLSVLALGCILIYGLSGCLSSPSPDCFSILLQIIILCSFTWQIKENRSGKFVFFLFLSVIAVLTKFSNVFLCLVILLIVFIKESNKKIVLINALPFSLILGIVWCTRSVLLTGYALYPIPWPNFNVDWKLPYGTLKEEQIAITGWARLPGDHYREAAHGPISYWIKNWILVTGISIFHNYLRWFFIGELIFLCSKQKKDFLQQWIIILPVFFSLLFWFITAPDPRFAQGILYFSIIYPFSLAFQQYISSIKRGVILLCIWGLLFIPIFNILSWRFYLVQDFPVRFWRRYDIRYTDSKLPISYVKDCWYGAGHFVGRPPLPATPYFNRKIILRGKSLQNGFRLEK